MPEGGTTLLELLVVVALIPLVGLTLVQIDLLTQNYFNRTTRNMIPDQEVELALAAMERDVFVARSIIVFQGGWNPVTNRVAPGVEGDRMELLIDDDNGTAGGNTPFDNDDDDLIRYWRNGATVERLYAVDGGTFEAPQIVARHMNALELIQTVNQSPSSPPESLPPPQNVIRATVRAVLGQTTVERTRYITSRAFRSGS